MGDRFGLSERGGPIDDASRAPGLPSWALWLAVDDDGAVHVFDRAPSFLGIPEMGVGQWLPLPAPEARGARVCADSLDWSRVEENRVPKRGGNGRCYLLVEPLHLYLRPASRRARIVRALRERVRRILRLADER